jgi:hypothetical protein
MTDIVHWVLVFSLFIALICSFIIFIQIIIIRNKTHKKLFNTWQFPTLLAIFIDAIYYTNVLNVF